MKTRTIFLALLGLMLGFTTSGCFSTASKDEHYYSLVFSRPANARPIAIQKKVRIAVAQFHEAPGYESPNIAYRVSPHEMHYYGFRRWVAEPGRMLQDSAIRVLEASKNFALVDSTDALRDENVVVSGTVDAIEEVDHDDIWMAHLAMTITVRDAEADKVVFRHVFDRMVPCSDKTLPELARAISEIFQTEILTLAQRIAH